MAAPTVCGTAWRRECGHRDKAAGVTRADVASAPTRQAALAANAMAGCANVTTVTVADDAWSAA